MEENAVKKSGFAITSLVLGIIGVVLSFIIIINNLAFILGILAIIFGIIPIIRHQKKGMAIGGIVLGVVAIVITLIIQYSASVALDEASASLDKALGNSTEEVLIQDCSVTIGTLSLSTDEYGFVTSSLPVTITNTTDETLSYNFHIEAVAPSGDRIGEDYIYVNDLSAGQSITKDVFTYIASDQVDAYSTASFQIVEASAY